jgi:poly(glycerol-phosphate) alpha-glucosyltransferase
LHVGLLTASASRLGGGVASAVEAQARMIRDRGGRATVIALEDAYSGEAPAALGETPLLTAKPRGPRLLGYAPGLARKLAEADPDLLHLHGIWTDLSRIATRWARQTGRAYLISPHGMLDPWITGRGRWKKALARAGYERASWARADAFHALTEDEAADIRREAGDCPVHVIPNAGPPAAPDPGGSRRPLVVYLGRVHPKKNLAALVAGWRGAALPPEAELAIAGWGAPADVGALEAGVRQGPPSIRFLGPVHGEAKQALLREARFMVLPSLSEGLPMAILEAWAAGTPTLMTAACHLPQGFAAGAALDCGIEPQAIADRLEHALAIDDSDWARMAEAALDLARGPFSADHVSRRWVEAYRALAKRPPAA